jgi:hypothetical protein
MFYSCDLENLTLQVSDADLACPARKKTMPTCLAATASIAGTASLQSLASPSIDRAVAPVVVPVREARKGTAAKSVVEVAVETLEITLTPCFAEQKATALPVVEQEERSSDTGLHEADEEAMEEGPREEKLTEKSESVEPGGRRTQGDAEEEAAAMQLPEVSEQATELTVPAAKDSRSVSLDSDLELSEEESEEEEEGDKESPDGESRPVARPVLFSDSDHEDLSDDDRSHKRRVDRTGEGDEPLAGDSWTEASGRGPASPVVEVEETPAAKYSKEALIELVRSPIKVDPTKRKYRNFLEELLHAYEAEEKEKERLLEAKRAQLKRERDGYAYETFRDTLKRNLKNLKGSQNRQSFEAIVKSFCTLESDINKMAICDYIYTIFMVCTT